ncbi:hypothetical protein ACGFY9_39890 [Streptomyces sp. NPDC048504]|uniref:hypothetical protein n=1 Tax=Streptomyces sp. NPDC048504 TaxID=3365559 RepID=UPI00371B047A
MSDQQQPCMREGLRIVLNEPHYWGVQDNGQADFDDYEGSSGESTDFDSYYCDNCGEFFTKAEERSDAWLAALDHLPKQEATT